MHAAGLPLRVQRRAVGVARRQGARDQVLRAVRAHRARQRALHPLLALRALHARDLEVQRARHRAPRRRTRWSAPPRTARSTHDPYSDNVIDICPVGALLSRPFLHKARVWYLKPTPSVCPGCARGCTVEVWHRKPEWKLHALDPDKNTSIERVTPLENPAVNGPWICNKGRDLAQIFERPRADAADAEGQAGRARRRDRRRARACSAKPGTRSRWCRTGARTRSSTRSSARWAPRFTDLRQGGLRACSRASGSRTTC